MRALQGYRRICWQFDEAPSDLETRASSTLERISSKKSGVITEEDELGTDVGCAQQRILEEVANDLRDISNQNYCTLANLTLQRRDVEQ